MEKSALIRDCLDKCGLKHSTGLLVIILDICNVKLENAPLKALICVVTTFWGIPHNVVAMVFTAADSLFRISPYCRKDNF